MKSDVPLSGVVNTSLKLAVLVFRFFAATKSVADSVPLGSLTVTLYA